RDLRKVLRPLQDQTKQRLNGGRVNVIEHLLMNRFSFRQRRSEDAASLIGDHACRSCLAGSGGRRGSGEAAASGTQGDLIEVSILLVPIPARVIGGKPNPKYPLFK